MEMYEIIARTMELYGFTFDEALTYAVLISVGSVVGFTSLLCLFADLGRYLYRGLKKLLRFLLRQLRRRVKL